MGTLWPRPTDILPKIIIVHLSVVNTSLDAATTHPSLLLSENRRQVTWQERHQNLPSPTQRFNSFPRVLGQWDISWGRWMYWEVNVEDAHSWDLGICRDKCNKEGEGLSVPTEWFLGHQFLWGGTLGPHLPRNLSMRKKPLRVWIFLDYEDGDVSFYNMIDRSHIFSFSQNTFSRALRPLFRLWSPDSGPLTRWRRTDIIHMPM